MLLIHEVGLREFQQKQTDIKERVEETRNPQDLNSEIIDNYFHEQRLLSGHHFCEIYLLTNNSSIQVGYISYWHSQNINVKRSKLIEIRIFSAYQGLGFGTRIIKSILRESLEFGSLYLSLVVFSRNAQANTLYHRLGFISWKKFDKSEMMISLLR